MLCAIASTMLLGGTVMFGLAAGFFVEEVATRLGYKPTNYLARWQAVRKSAQPASSGA